MKKIFIAFTAVMLLSISVQAQPDTLWTRTFGGSNSDWSSCGIQTIDEGYIIVGSTESYGSGNGDVYLIKTDTNGYELWQRTYGGTNNDHGNSIHQTSDGGFIIAGGTYILIGANYSLHNFSFDCRSDSQNPTIYLLK